MTIEKKRKKMEERESGNGNEKKKVWSGRRG